MKATALWIRIIPGLMLAPLARADEFLALPGLWQSLYEPQGGGDSTGASGETRVVWHCVVDGADPWAAFAQLRDLPGMTCARNALERTSTTLNWRMECHGPGPPNGADRVESVGSIVFDSAQHYTGRVTLSGTLLGYPWRSTARLEGWRRAACTGPAD
jgi:hypothetical protein